MSPYKKRFLQQAAEFEARGNRAAADLRRGMALHYDTLDAESQRTLDLMESIPSGSGSIHCSCNDNACACMPYTKKDSHEMKNTRDDSAAAREEMIARLRGNAKRDDAQRDDAQRDDAKPEPLGTPEQERARLIERMRKAAR